MDVVFGECGDFVEYCVGIMIEIFRAALLSNEIVKYVEFFLFGMNDLM